MTIRLQASEANQVTFAEEGIAECVEIQEWGTTQSRGTCSISLRAVYRTLELPGQNPLKDAHAALDAAVLAAYGFSPKRDLLQQLLDLNLDVAARIDRGDPVTAPGIPPDFPNPLA